RAVDKSGNESRDSMESSTTVSPIRQTVAAAWSQPRDEKRECTTDDAVPDCPARDNRRQALFTIRNTGNVAENGANITVNSMGITWGVTGGTVRKSQAPDRTNIYCSTTGTASGSTITLTPPLEIKAGAPPTTMGIYFCTTGDQPTFVSVQFNISDGSFTLY
ncbi:hypothetical protein HKBW3S09_01917, partial [Candidatus Hakubella thermalkaliphila]